jgi:hypothetical protein
MCVQDCDMCFLLRGDRSLKGYPDANSGSFSNRPESPYAPSLLSDKQSPKKGKLALAASFLRCAGYL